MTTGALAVPGMQQQQGGSCCGVWSTATAGIMDQITDAMGQVPLMANYRGKFTPGKMRPCCDEGERRRWQLNELKCMEGKFRPGLWHGERRLWRVNEGSLYSTMSSGPGQQSV